MLTLKRFVLVGVAVIGLSGCNSDSQRDGDEPTATTSSTQVPVPSSTVDVPTSVNGGEAGQQPTEPQPGATFETG